VYCNDNFNIKLVIIDISTLNKLTVKVFIKQT